MASGLFTAFALVFIIEGILPLIMPALWRETFTKMISFTDGQLRSVGLVSMLGGLLILIMVR
ncbi:DUF2065 domain-containing protein [Sulfuriferula sp. AH1]|uniref:DUF2065 domain-containing protein n=1 Tax=Sulfuriferula sp. AH1 TaxID=1985873 RepID=UPI000B3BABDE|nr:DUF2065 domain-containing protein [Sulfuriferula sp. AH1]ARU31238.1 DUF2065 domain-containing protein [Sulfuriferula sp. AH1]